MHFLSTRLIIIADSVGGAALIIMVLVFFIIPLYQEYIIAERDSDTLNEAERIVSVCREKKWHECYKSELVGLTREKGLRFGEIALSFLQDIDPESRNCHVLAHFMAREAIKRDPSQWKILLDSINVGACGSGFLHGILEARIGIDPSLKVDAALAEEICGIGNDAYKKRMCFHFMGHVFLVDTEGDISAALPQCRRVSIFQFRYECFDGLFMEDHQKLALAEHGSAPLPDITQSYVEKLSSECRKYSREEGQACWQEMGEIYAKLYSYNPSKVYEGCGKAPTGVERQSCYLKGVVVMAVYTGFDTEIALREICAPYSGKNETYRSCIYTALSSFMFYSPKYIDRGIILCASLIADHQQDCFKTLVDALKAVVPSSPEQKFYCERVPVAYRRLCDDT